MTNASKIMIGIIAIVLMGFVTFATVASISFVSTQLLISMDWWHIVIGTGLGVVMVFSSLALMLGDD